MADVDAEYNVNNALVLENAFSINGVKDEECQDDDFADDKVDIFETAIIKGNVELQNQLLPKKMKQHDICTTWDNIKTELSFPGVQHDPIHGLKIEEGISAHIKLEFNNGFLYCQDCHIYCEEYCAKCGMLVHILNRPAMINDIIKSQEDLPGDNMLEIQDYFGGFHIHALKVIPAGVKFGPFVGLNRTEHPWKIKSGKFVVNTEKFKYLNWMQWINPARNIAEQNLLVFQYEHNLYYQSTRQIQEGDELLVYFGAKYEDSLNRNVEMDFTPITKHILKDVFACTFSCLGFSSKLYLAKHKTVCPRNVAGGFSVEELIQCPYCNIHMDRKEYNTYHMAYCCETNDRKYILPTPDNRTAQGNERKIRPRQIYKCQQCKYRTKYKGDLEKHTNLHYEVKMYKCGICCKRFKTKEILRLHLDATHIGAGDKEDSENFTGAYMNTHVKVERLRTQDETKQFKCSMCEFRTKYKTYLKTHLKSKHLKQFKYKCDMCDYITNVRGSLKTHTATRHLKEFKYQCDICDYKANLMFCLKRHIEGKHLREFKYKCDTCDYKANVKGQLKKHIETKHLKEFKYQCESCDYKANLKFCLKRHITTKHLREFKYKCDTCNYKTNVKGHLKAHIEGKHLKEFKHKCDRCDYKSNFKFALKKHIQGKHLRVKHKCDSCDYETNLMSCLKSHIDTKHLKEFKHKCEACEYKTNWKTHLDTHVKARHLKEFKYKCETCDYQTCSNSNLKRHIEVKHLKEFKYQCDICDYKASQKGNLKAHIKARHLKEFKHKCDTCDYKTNVMSDLQKHVEGKHLREFKYKCETCDYKANQKGQLKSHIETKHLKEFKHKCDICEYKTNFKSALKKHVEIKHLK